MATIVTTDAAGTLILPAEVLGGPHPNTPYIVESDGDELSVRLQNGHVPQDDSEDDAPAALSSEEWARQWKEVSTHVGALWPAGVSAADVISEMRNARGQGLDADH